MRYLAIKFPDGHIEKKTIEESVAMVRQEPMSYIEIECMLGGIPSPRFGGMAVIVDTDVPHQTADFFL